MTTFGDMVYTMGGVPLLAGIPFGPTSKVFFVAPGTGSDGNKGTSVKKPLKTLAKAHSLMTANSNDVCFLIAQSNTAADTTDYQAATLTWSKDLCHLIGVGAPSQFSQRARIAQTSTATAVSPSSISQPPAALSRTSRFSRAWPTRHRWSPHGSPGSATFSKTSILPEWAMPRNWPLAGLL